MARGGIRMSAIQVRGLRPISGTIEIQGSKNAVLPMMAAALLTAGVTVIRHVPAIEDVFSMIKIMECLGCRCEFQRGILRMDTTELDNTRIPRTLVEKMRSSSLLLGPLLSRAGEAESYYPGGCVLGKRPIDLHIYALKKLGAEFFEAENRIMAKASELTGSEICFYYPSVGATENAVMAAVLAKGTTVLSGCAKEPEIIELCRFLTEMGAKIYGAGESRIVIEGVKELYPADFILGGDRICAGTYLAAAMAAGGEITVSGIEPGFLREPISVMRHMGAKIEIGEMEIRLQMDRRPYSTWICTGPYPEFPTDLQSVFLAVASMAEGKSSITETVFEARFATADIMKRFGAGIYIDGRTVRVDGIHPLRPAVADAPDLRGGAALLVAALAADGKSMIGNCEHIARGYEDICRDLTSLGADVGWYGM